MRNQKTCKKEGNGKRTRPLTRAVARVISIIIYKNKIYHFINLKKKILNMKTLSSILLSDITFPLDIYYLILVVISRVPLFSHSI